MARFEFDADKSRRNAARHGVSLAWAVRLWSRDHVIVPAKEASGEPRWLILAKVDGRCFMAVFARRGRSYRIISCHRADTRYERVYEVLAEAGEA